MNDKERAAMQQALEALIVAEEFVDRHSEDWYISGQKDLKQIREAITALREALGYCIDEGCPHHGTTHECTNPLAEPDIEEMTLTQIAARHEQAEQEPLAWMNTNGAVNKLREAGWAMNAAPVRTKDLTDDEINDVMEPNMSLFDFARSVIAADREKNK